MLGSSHAPELPGQLQATRMERVAEQEPYQVRRSFGPAWAYLKFRAGSGTHLQVRTRDPAYISAST